MSATVLKSYQNIKDRIKKISAGAHPTPTLIVVTKTISADDIEPLIKIGHRHFGENRVQEAQKKWPAIKQKYPDIVLHMIGSLQTNKAKDAARLFDVIHTVDRIKLAEALVEAKFTAPCFVQVNTGSEPQKGGINPVDLEDFFKNAATKKLNICGLMAIPPVDDNPIPHFEQMKNLAHTHNVEGLSMGMSADYEQAILHGATHIRVGSAIFGRREK